MVCNTCRADDIQRIISSILSPTSAIYFDVCDGGSSDGVMIMFEIKLYFITMLKLDSFELRAQKKIDIGLKFVSVFKFNAVFVMLMSAFNRAENQAGPTKTLS